MATRPANTNRVSPDRGRRPDTFSPVVIYYRTAASITAAHGEAKPSDGKKSPLEPESFAKRPTTPATLAQPRALKPSPKVPTSFQPVTIHYPSHGTPASASVLRASDAEIAIERTPKNSLRELNAPKVGPASKVAAQPLRAFSTNATISPTASPAVSLPQDETKSALPGQTNPAADQPAPPEAKESEVVGDGAAGPAPADPVTQDRGAEDEPPAAPTLTTPTETTRNAAPVTVQPIQETEGIPPVDKNEPAVSEESGPVSELPNGPSATVESAPSAESVPSDDVLKNSSDPVALNNAGVHFTLQSRYDDALTALGRAIAAAPTQWRFHRNLSLLYERMNRMDEALAEAQRSAELAPREPAGIVQLCTLKVMTGHEAEAIGCFDKLAEMGPLDVESQTLYGIALLRTGESRKALSVLESTAGRGPANIATLNALGLAYFNLKRYSDSARCFKQAIELDPKHGELRFNLAIAQTANRNKEASLSQYRILKEENPKLAEQLYQILFQDSVVQVDALKKR